MSALQRHLVTKHVHGQNVQQGSSEFIQRNWNLDHVSREALNTGCDVIRNDNRWDMDHIGNS